MLEFDDSISLADILPFIEEKLSIGLWRSNDKGQMQWSRGFYELFGLDPRQTGPSPAEIERRIHPDDRGRVRWLNQRSIEHGMLEDEFRIIRPNGTLRRIWARAEPLLDPAGTPQWLLGLAADVTEKRNLSEALNIATERCVAMARSARGLVWTASRDGHISAFSEPDQCVDQVGPGSSWADLLHDEEREAVLRQWQFSLATGQPYEVESRLRQADGAYHWHQCKAVPLGNGNGGVREWLGVWVDAHYDILARERKGSSKLTGRQLRAARGMLNWSVKQLAERSGVSCAVIRRLEEYNDTPPASDDLLQTLWNTFAGAGIEFTFPLVGKPGVRPK
ncbi:hypothetical protein XH80_06520 [Bradyrhizobium sp. CCBAU 45384]|nr:hypothetical protein [Bradyrhizobium sp. CCBAU 45384]